MMVIFTIKDKLFHDIDYLYFFATSLCLVIVFEMNQNQDQVRSRMMKCQILTQKGSHVEEARAVQK